jgi:hypothetical protein
MRDWAADVTAVIAVAALLITLWQARRIFQLNQQANAGPVIASVFTQFRDAKFRQAIDNLRSLPVDAAVASFKDLPDAPRDSAYTVCYFFEYLGHLVAFGHLDSDHVLGTMSSQLIEVWRIMRPWIAGERAARAIAVDPYQGRDFLPYYENLVTLIAAENGGAARRIRSRQRVRHFDPTHELAAVPPGGGTGKPVPLRIDPDGALHPNSAP